MVRFAQSYLADNPLLAEDIVVDAFIYYWEHRDKFTAAGSNPAGYVFSIVKTRCLNYLRNERKILKGSGYQDKLWELDMKMESLQSNDPDILFASELSQIINSSIEKLSAKTRLIFYLKKMDGMKYSEIAKTLNISVKDVEYHISKAMSQLRGALADYWDNK